MSNFDFNKAINGEPIYCNGVQVYPVFSLTEQMFGILAQGQTYITWNKDGTIEYDQHYKHSLTTDPPKKKVKKTVWVTIATWRYDKGDKSSFDTTPAFFDKQSAIRDMSTVDNKIIGTYPIEIEVEE